MRTDDSPVAALPKPGRLEWIGLTPVAGAALHQVPQAAAAVGQGLTGDHHAKKRPTKREVTIIQQECLPVIAACLGADSVRPEQLRRNLSVSGINVVSLKDCRFQIGEVLLEGTGHCPPCERMEDTLGPGGLRATCGQGGITARVVRAGTLRLGDQVRVVAE